MTSGLTTALLAGAFALAGALGAVLLTSHFAQRADQRRITSEDQRRWLADRRQVYAHFLGLVTAMLRDIDNTAIFLPGAGVSTGEAEDEDEDIVSDKVFDFYQRWDNELQPVLGEVQLLAETKVAELADRTSWALMELNGFMDSHHQFDAVCEYGNRARYLLEKVRNAMRAEIGLTSPVHTFPIPKDWPWLPDEPKVADDSTPSLGRESGD